MLEHQYWAKCDSCRSKDQEAFEAKRMDDAAIVETWDGWVYADGIGREYFEDVDGIYEAAAEDDVEVPEFAFCCSERKLHIDASNVLENALDDHHEDAYDKCDVDELQELLDTYCKKQNVTTYYPDYSKKVRVREKVEGKAS